jgi:AraC family transcriptional regulator
MLQSSVLLNSEIDSVHAAMSGVRSGFTARRRGTIEGHRVAVKRVLDLMRKDLSKPLDIAEMARVALISRYHFLRVFEAVTGVSPHRFLASLRIEQAKSLLIDTSLPVTTICFEVGYSSLGTFTRLFVEYVGISPLSFRRLSSKLAQQSLMSLIARYLKHRQPSRSNQTISGRVRGPEDFAGVSFVGLFETSIPQRRPLDGTIVIQKGVFELALPNRSQSYWIMAAGLPAGSDAFQSLILPRSELFVTSSQVFCTVSGAVIPHTCELTLRRPDEFDPPILTALPLLLGA